MHTENPEFSSASSGSQLSTIFILFVTLRLTILFLYTPQGLLNAYTDYNFYFRTSQLSEQGYLPFMDMWYEYPPVSSYIVHFAYLLTDTIVPLNHPDTFGYQLYGRVLGTILLVFECGTLILIHRIASSIWGISRANWTAWVYSGLSLPLFYWNASHTGIMVFFFMLAVERYISGKQIQSALALGLGIAAKLTPIFLLIPITQYLWRKRQIKWLVYLAVSGITVGLIYLPFLIKGGGPWVVASFKAVGKVGSWSTIWALLDGNWGPGNFGPLTTRLQLDLSAIPHSNPSIIPEYLKSILFAIPFGWFILKYRSEYSPKAFLWFTTLTAAFFHIWSKGWSPQWAMLVIPLLLLSFPDRRGISLILLLMGFTFIEWPIGDVLNNHFITATVILCRTAIFIIAAYLTSIQLLNKSPLPQNILSRRHSLSS